MFFNNVNDLLAAPARTWQTLFKRDTMYEVKRVVFHPMYVHNSFDYNIAVLEVKGSVLPSNTPIKLATAGSELY